MKRKTYTVSFQMSGSVVFDAESEEEARDIFNELSFATIYEEAGNPVITEIYEDVYYTEEE